MMYDHETWKRQKLVRLVLSVLMGLLGLVVMELFSPAWADVVCGDTIGPHQTVILQNDILDCKPDKDGWALIVIGPATLNLNGHRVTHTTEDKYQKEIGIKVTGQNAKVLNGIVMGFKWGFFVEGDGNHLAQNTAAYNKKGFTVEGNRNMLNGNRAFNNTSENYQIPGDKNWLVNNDAYGGDEECFLIDGGNENWLLNNAAYVGGSGFVVQGEDGTGPGGNYNKIWNCTAIGNAEVGILAGKDTEGNYIFNNKVSFNGLGVTPYGNDVQDNNLNCENNNWRKNNFETSNPDCIK